MDTTTWESETLARECGRTIEALWDGVNQSTNKMETLAREGFGDVTIPTFDAPATLHSGVEVWQKDANRTSKIEGRWSGWIEGWRNLGWRLSQVEFQHVRFDTNRTGRPLQSHFEVKANLENERLGSRATLAGPVVVRWGLAPLDSQVWPIESVDATALGLATRSGATVFRETVSIDLEPAGHFRTADPLLVYDLDGDGMPEIALVGQNLVLRRQSDGTYSPGPLCRHPLTQISTAVLADIDGDGWVDLVVAKTDGVHVFVGDEKGEFSRPDRHAWRAIPLLASPMVLAAGDVDGDGRLDLFLGQYRVPALGEIFRPSYGDALDGYPAFLLRNDGNGRFVDITVGSGLETRRNRRIFSASFVPQLLQGGGEVGLILVSDFAGLDYFLTKDGRNWSDRSERFGPERSGFGMAHALSDFNSDGNLDVLMIGMTSPVVERLEHLGINRELPQSPPSTPRVSRAKMVTGNRLFLGKGDSKWREAQPPYALARSGWSWGCGVIDVENDGFPDVYIANGHETKETVKDYESDFWLHDIFIEASVDPVAATDYFLKKHATTRGSGWSYRGNELNCLFLNQGDGTFVEAAFLLGVSLVEDCRNVIAQDLNADGRVDLVVTTLEKWPEERQRLLFYENRSTAAGNWIGIRSSHRADKTNSLLGATVIARTATTEAARTVLTGDSFRAQNDSVVHFGLGDAAKVDSVEVIYADGHRSTVVNPALNQYHRIEGK